MELEQLCRRVYGAYQYLHDHDLSAVSGTSKRLRSGDLAKLRQRLAEELLELHGVIEGTHFHEGFASDLILEGYEVLYWAICLAVASGKAYDELQPHVLLEHGFAEGKKTKREVLLDTLAHLAEKTKTEQDLASIFFNVGSACATNATPPARLLERDIAEMSQKAYLAPYWAELEAVS